MLMKKKEGTIVTLRNDFGQRGFPISKFENQKNTWDRRVERVIR